MTSPMEVVIKNLQEIGAFQFLFPFMLTAAVFYGLLRRSKIFGEPEKNVGVNAVVALIAAFMVWSYPVLTGVNVEVMLAKFFFQGIIATLVIIVGLLIVTTFLPGSLGEFLGEKLKEKKGWIAILILCLLIGFGIFTASGAASVFFPKGAGGGTSNETITSAAIIIALVAVLGFIIYFTTKEEKK